MAGNNEPEPSSDGSSDQPSEGQSEEINSTNQQGFGRGRKQAALIGIIVVGVMVWAAIADDDSDDDAPTGSRSPSATDSEPQGGTGGTSGDGYTDNDPEYQLAAIDGAGLANSDVAPYDRALDRAEQVCTQDRRLIADMTVHAVQEEVSGETNLSMLRALGRSVPDEAAPMDCAEVYASIITLMREG